MTLDILTPEEVQKLRDLISQSQNIIICCHESPDGDAIGAMLGWAEFLRNQGKQPMLVAPDAFPDFLRWLPCIEKIVRYDKHNVAVEEAFQKADLVFCLDFNSSKRLWDMQETLDKFTGNKVLIDHHLGPDIDAQIIVSKPEMSSTCELLFRIIYQMGGFEAMTKQGAVPLYCGMMTDTGGFTYNSSRSDIFYIISLLLTKRFDKDKIYRSVYNNYSEWAIRMRGYVMSQKLNVLPDSHASYFSITRKEMKRFHFIKGDAEGLVNEPLRIKGMRMVISLREDTVKDNTVWVSIRSVDHYYCNTIAEKFFNGGGHPNAAGGHLYCTIEEAEQVALEAIIYFTNMYNKG